jgi:ferrochelatase
MSRQGLLMISFGGPHEREDIRPFLRNVLAGRPIPEPRFEAVVQHYELLGGRSPITEHTQSQADALATELARRGRAFDVRIGMRHWKPWLKDTLLAFREAGFRELWGLIMAAQETEASAARYVQAVDAARAEIGPDAPSVRYVSGWGLSEGVMEAHACNLARGYARLSLERRERASLLFSAHSVPVPMAKSSPYVAQLEETAARVAALVGVPTYRLVYQSRSGNPRDPWLEPDVLDALSEEAARGVRDVLVSPIGFLCDHVEVLYDLDIEAKRKAEELGITLHRVPTLGTHPAFIRALAESVERAQTRAAP